MGLSWWSFTAGITTMCIVIICIYRPICLGLINLHSCIIKKNCLLKVCTLCFCCRLSTVWGTQQKEECVTCRFPKVPVHTLTYACTNTLLFSLKHLGLLCCCAGKSRFPSTKTIFHLEDGTQVFVYSLHSITPSLVYLTFHTHDLILCLVALQICELMLQLSAEAACGVEFIKPTCPLCVYVCTWQNDGIPGKKVWVCMCVCVYICDATVKGTICSVWQ